MAGQNRLFLIGAALVILGLCFKVSIFPLHAWTPDVYQGAPTPVTAFMATGVKAVTFVVFLRLLSTDILASEQSTSLFNVMQWLAALTMLAGNIAAIMQNNLKRMLAYSSVAHSGYMMIGLIVAGIGGQDTSGATSVLFYAVAYALMTAGAFGVVGLLEKNENTLIEVDDLRGLSRRNPVIAAALALFMLSLAGIPPTIGFFGKFFIFSAAIKNGLVWLAIWGVVSSVISVYYYLRPVVAMYMRDEEGVSMAPQRLFSAGLVSVSAALVVILGIWSSPLYAVLTSAAAHL